MSNHSGSYMLNDVLRFLFSEESKIGSLSLEQRRYLVKRISEIGEDTNYGEIVENLWHEAGICRRCYEEKNPATLDEDGCCVECLDAERRYKEAMAKYVAGNGTEEEKQEALLVLKEISYSSSIFDHWECERKIKLAKQRYLSGVGTDDEKKEAIALLMECRQGWLFESWERMRKAGKSSP